VGHPKKHLGKFPASEDEQESQKINNGDSPSSLVENFLHFKSPNTVASRFKYGGDIEWMSPDSSFFIQD